MLEKKHRGDDMTKIAVWCRHTQDNVIGIGPHIPWKISSDFKRFRRITENKSLIAGEKTYESFPNRTLPNRKIYVLTFNPKYKVSDEQNHFVISDIEEFRDMEEELYIAGGASIYKAFMGGGEGLIPDVVVDSMYKGDLDANLKGEKVDITPCINILKEKYICVSPEYEEDNIITTVWVKKGDFVDQAVIKHIFKAIENNGEK